MTGDGRIGSERSASADAAVPGADPAIELGAAPTSPRPFARPTPSNGVRLTPSLRPTPFVVPAASGADADAPPTGAADGIAETSRRPTPAPDAAGESRLDAGQGPPRAPSVEAQAAAVLVAVAERLQAGDLRLPVRVDCGYPPAALAAVLAALHAEATDAPQTVPTDNGRTERVR